MWTLKDDPSGLTTAEKTRLISDFHELNPAGQVVFTGGETMMKKAEFFSLTRHCRTLGLRSAANTNGSFIQPEDHDILMCDGPNYLVLSLDSNLSSLHDYSRGVPGSFAATVATIAALLRARGYQSGRSMVEIITNSVVSADNIEGLFDFLAFVTELGVDGATLQILSPTFHRRGGRDVFYERHFFKDKGRAVAVLDELRHRREEFPVLRITDTDLRWMQMYIERPELLDEPVCNSHERNIMVDYLGDVQLCFDMRQIFDGKPIGNIRLQPLHVLWGGQRAAAAREIMEHCRRSCGMLNCHRRPV